MVSRDERSVPEGPTGVASRGGESPVRNSANPRTRGFLQEQGDISKGLVQKGPRIGNRAADAVEESFFLAFSRDGSPTPHAKGGASAFRTDARNVGRHPGA